LREKTISHSGTRSKFSASQSLDASIRSDRSSPAASARFRAPA
jgi:hypothetical protein